MTTEDGRWLRRFHSTRTTGPRLICFPHAGGSATYFHALSAALSEDADVVAIQYPGRQDRRGEPPITDIEVLADEIVTALNAFDDRPLACFGHSLGATIAYEVALRLERTGRPPAHLFASGCRAPSRWRGWELRQADDTALVRAVVGLNESIAEIFRDPELQEIFLSVLRADCTAAAHYRDIPGRQLCCPLTVLLGDRDPVTSADDAQAWRHHTRGKFEFRLISGDHFYLERQTAAVRSSVLLGLGIASKSAR